MTSSTATAWRSLVILQLLYVVSVLDRGLPVALIEPMKADLGLSEAQIGLVVGGPFALLYAVTAIPMGMLVDRYSRKRVIFFGLAIWSLATAYCGLPRNLGQMLLGRSITAIGEAGLSPAAYSILPQLFPVSRRTFVIALFTMGGAIGSGLSLIFGANLLEFFTNGGGMAWAESAGLKPWQAVFVAAGLIGLPVLLLVPLIHEPPRASVTGRDAPLVPLARLLWNGRSHLIPLFIGFSAAGAATFSAYTWSSTVLIRHFGFEHHEASSTIGIIYLVGPLVGSPLMGMLADYLSRRGRHDAQYVLYMLGASTLGSMLIASLVAGSSTWFLVSLGLFSIVLIPHFGLAMAALSLVTKTENRGRVSASLLLMYSLTTLGGGSLLVGLTTDLIFADPSKVAYSLALCLVLFFGTAVISLGYGRKAFLQSRLDQGEC